MGEAGRAQGRWAGRLPARRLSALVCALVALFFGAWVVFVSGRVWAAGERDGARASDALVVLGAAQYGGWPSPVFRARLDHALRLYGEGEAPLVVVVGGRGVEGPHTEADAGVAYLRSRGAPPDALLPVGRGDSTYSSLRAVEEVTRRKGVGSILLVSDRFHMFRSLAMARDLGLRARGSPTTTSPVEGSPGSRLFYTLREVAAFTVYVLAGPPRAWQEPPLART